MPISILGIQVNFTTVVFACGMEVASSYGLQWNKRYSV